MRKDYLIKSVVLKLVVCTFLLIPTNAFASDFGLASFISNTFDTGVNKQRADKACKDKGYKDAKDWAGVGNQSGILTFVALCNT